MALSGTTSISNLPVSSQIEQMNPIVQHENIKIENTAQNMLEQRNDGALEQQNYNQLVSGLQQASASGQTSLPSRDMPQDTRQLVQDEQIQPNYIPPAPQDYIQNSETTQNIINTDTQNEKTVNNLESIYQEFQLPLLVTILYFLFQLPIIRKYLQKIIPSLFNTDGNPKFSGFVFNSIAFGATFMVLLKTMNYFTTI